MTTPLRPDWTIFRCTTCHKILDESGPHNHRIREVVDAVGIALTVILGGVALGLLLL